MYVTTSGFTAYNRINKCQDQLVGKHAYDLCITNLPHVDEVPIFGIRKSISTTEIQVNSNFRSSASANLDI